MTEESSEERRRYTRVEFEASATLSQGKLSYQTRIIDVSLNGILLEPPERYELNATQPVDIVIRLADDTAINMRATLVHSGTHLLGFQCDTIDMESVTHLRRLIELNMDEPGAPERVLNELLQR